MSYKKTGIKVSRIITYFVLNPGATSLDASKELKMDWYEVRKILNQYSNLFQSTLSDVINNGKKLKSYKLIHGYQVNLPNELALDIEKRIKVETYIKKICVEQEETFWGTKYKFTPALVDTIIDDGLTLIAIQPLNTRPAYYIARVDSSFALLDDELEDVQSLVELIEGEIESQFGRDEDEDEDGDGWFPKLSDSSGVTWWEIDIDV